MFKIYREIHDNGSKSAVISTEQKKFFSNQWRSTKKRFNEDSLFPDKKKIFYNQIIFKFFFLYCTIELNPTKK